MDQLFEIVFGGSPLSALVILAGFIILLGFGARRLAAFFPKGENQIFDPLGLTGPLSEKLVGLLQVEPKFLWDKELKDVSDLTDRVLTKFGAVSSYSMMMKGVSLEDGKSLAIWRYDVVLPDKFHARQFTFIEQWADEWIRMGDRHFSCSAFWVQSPDEVDEDSGIDKAADISFLSEILRNNKPFESYECQIFEEVFFCLGYAPPFRTNTPLSPFLVGESEWENRRIRIFVGASSCLIEKVTVLNQIRLEDELIETEINIAFAAFNEDILVDMPTELLPKLNDEGQQAISFEVDPTVPFHEWR